MTPSERERRKPREVMNWVICEDTGQQAVNGVCPTHHGDACLIAVGWVDNSHVRRDLAEVQSKLWEAEAAAREFWTALDDLVAVARPVLEPRPERLVSPTMQRARDALAHHPSFSGEEGTEG